MKKKKVIGIGELKTPNSQENIEDMFDVILAEVRKDEPTVSWDDVKKKLKSKGKL